MRHQAIRTRSWQDQARKSSSRLELDCSLCDRTSLACEVKERSRCDVITNGAGSPFSYLCSFNFILISRFVGLLVFCHHLNNDIAIYQSLFRYLLSMILGFTDTWSLLSTMPPN